MRALVSHADRPAVTVGLFSIALVFVVGRGVPALRAWQQGHISAAAEIRESVLAEERGIAAMPELRDSLAARTRFADSLRARLLSGVTPEAAAASLASLVEHAAENQGMDVETVTFLADTVLRAGFARVTARITALGDVDGFVNLLREVETHRALLAVRSLIVTQSDPTAPSSRPEALRVEVAVQALAVVTGRSGDRRSGAIVSAARISPVAVLARLDRRPLAFDARATHAAADDATDANAFRISHQPSEAPYEPRRFAVVQAVVALAPRPDLVLKGIVGGPPWQAIIEGIPGQAASLVMSAGASFDRFTIQSVSRDSVVVRGTDTTWTLTLARKTP